MTKRLNLKKRIKIITSAVLYVFNFRKPVVQELHCIDLVAGNKLLFLLVWHTTNARQISVNPGRHRYKNTMGAAVVTLMPSTESVTVIIRNCWRRTVLIIPLKHITLDKQSLDALTGDLRVFKQLRIDDIEPPRNNRTAHVSFPQPILKTFQCQTSIEPHFKYQNFEP